MIKANLFWFGPHSVAGLKKALKQPVSLSDEKYPFLNNFGLYMYLDNNLREVVYLGQALTDGPRSLRDRIRWEITKDGNKCALSKFNKDCEELKIRSTDLFLKVAHIEEATENGSQIPIRDYKLINNIEMALIHEISQNTSREQPILNIQGKKRYRQGRIKIINNGNFSPLLKIVRK